MLKQMIVNGRTIPIPVPLTTLQDALNWVADHLSNPDQTLTRVVLEGSEIELETLESPTVCKTSLQHNPRLEIQMDSPLDLAIQSLEALTNLSSVVERGMKPVAVECWSLPVGAQSKEADNLFDDLDLIGDLLAHFLDLVDHRFGDITQFSDTAKAIQQHLLSLRLARSQSDLRGVAKVLLNKLEPLMSAMVNQCVRLESELIETKAKSPIAFPLKVEGIRTTRST